MYKIIKGLKRYRNKIIFFLVPLFIFFTILSFYSWSQTETISKVSQNNSQIVTSYDYKAKITPNVLYPNGGTFEAGNTIFQKITTEIPINIKSYIYSENQVTAKGTYNVQLVVKGGDFWERTFPLETNQNFEQKGTSVCVMDNSYTIDLKMIRNFIQKVENETGIIPNQYKIEVVPNIQGLISDDRNKMNILTKDSLKFQYSTNEITLDGEKTFHSMYPLSKTQMVKKLFTFKGITLPLTLVRLSSSGLSGLFLLILFFAYIQKVTETSITGGSKIEKINKKYRNRLIQVSQRLNFSQMSILNLYDFSSLIKIADEKELPIFFYNDYKDESAVYFIADGIYMYCYKVTKSEIVLSRKKGLGSEKAYEKAYTTI